MFFRRKGNLIRKISKEDADQVAKLHKKVWQLTYKGIMSESFLDNISVKKWSNSLKKIPELPNVSGYVLEVNNEIVGDIIFGKSRGEADYDYEIYALNVDLKFQKKGFGKILLNKALENFDDYDKIYLKVVFENENARKFYERCGFKNSGKISKTKFEDFILSECVYEYVGG